jgi:hypothetical protein
MTSTTPSAARVIEPSPDDAVGCSAAGRDAAERVRCVVARGRDCAARSPDAALLGVASVLPRAGPAALEPARRLAPAPAERRCEVVVAALLRVALRECLTDRGCAGADADEVVVEDAFVPVSFLTVPLVTGALP